MEEDFGFIEGFIYDRNNIIVLAASENLDEEDVDHAFICKLGKGEWHFWYEDFSVIKVCVFKHATGPVLIEMGANGEIRVGDATGFRWQTIDQTDEAPSRLRPLNDLRLVGNHLYVAGMRRQVFRRPIFDSKWERFDNGVMVPKKSKEIAGFLSIDGFDDSEIYAVGYSGQIWNFNGRVWKQVTSPTNLRLEAVRCVNGDFVVAVGHAGIVLKGRKNVWNVVEQNVTDLTLTDIETMSGSIYISTEDGLLYLLDGTALMEVDHGLGKEITTGNLHSDGETLLSVGERDLLLFDGKRWSQMSPPDLPRV